MRQQRPRVRAVPASTVRRRRPRRRRIRHQRSPPSRFPFRSAKLPTAHRTSSRRPLHQTFRHASRITRRNDAPDVDTSRSSTVTVSSPATPTPSRCITPSRFWADALPRSAARRYHDRPAASSCSTPRPVSRRSLSAPLRRRAVGTHDSAAACALFPPLPIPLPGPPRDSAATRRGPRVPGPDRLECHDASQRHRPRLQPRPARRTRIPAAARFQPAPHNAAAGPADLVEQPSLRRGPDARTIHHLHVPRPERTRSTTTGTTVPAGVN